MSDEFQPTMHLRFRESIQVRGDDVRTVKLLEQKWQRVIFLRDQSIPQNDHEWRTVETYRDYD